MTGLGLHLSLTLHSSSSSPRSPKDEGLAHRDSEVTCTFIITLHLATSRVSIKADFLESTLTESDKVMINDSY